MGLCNQTITAVEYVVPEEANIFKLPVVINLIMTVVDWGLTSSIDALTLLASYDLLYVRVL